MPLFKADGQLIFYAPVPMGGGAVVDRYLTERFGAGAFEDTHHTRHDPRSLWSKTSPQHIDRHSLGRLFPEGFFDLTFTVVRHPVERIISVYHFQLEIERLIPATTSFSEWLQDITELRQENPFVNDNHIRPMSDLVPEGAQVFHLEHGLEALVPWLDGLTQRQRPPREMSRPSKSRDQALSKVTRVTPSAHDLALISELYADDFARFGYDVHQPEPLAPKPTLIPVSSPMPDTAEVSGPSHPWRQLTRKIAASMGL